MENEINITGNLLKCKKGFYPIPTINETDRPVFTDLINYILDFSENLNSKYFNIRINGNGIQVLFPRNILISKEFDGTEKSNIVLNQYNLSLTKIENLD
jgi:hypothetical protein